MQIWAIDPGSVASGVALVNTENDEWWVKQFPDPMDVWELIETFGQRDDIILIEGYRTASALTKDAKATIELVGGFKMLARFGWGWGRGTYVERVEQHRLSGRREAARLMGGTIEELESDKERKDAFSALAHCIVYRRGLV